MAHTRDLKNVENQQRVVLLVAFCSETILISYSNLVIEWKLHEYCEYSLYQRECRRISNVSNKKYGKRRNVDTHSVLYELHGRQIIYFLIQCRWTTWSVQTDISHIISHEARRWANCMISFSVCNTDIIFPW